MKHRRNFDLARLLLVALVASIWILSAPAATWACVCCACDFGGGDIECGVRDTDCAECILKGGVPAPTCDACATDVECENGQALCAGDPGMCLSGATGACCSRGECAIVTAAGCAAADGVYRGDGTDCTEPCKRPNGDGCSTGDDCESTFCADGVCCNEACTGPNEVCDAFENRGTCIVVAAAEPAPALSPWALCVTAALLGIIGVVAVRRRGA
jgi:hypothetical protein